MSDILKNFLLSRRSYTDGNVNVGDSRLADAFHLGATQQRIAICFFVGEPGTSARIAPRQDINVKVEKKGL